MGPRAVIVVLLLLCSDARATPGPAVPLLPTGVALPYPTERLFRGFGHCRGRAGEHRHAAIDLGGVGPEGGIGTSVRALSNARVTMIGLASQTPKQFGLPDRRHGNTRRKGTGPLERMRVVPGYGEVFFFSALRGRWRTGNIIALQALDGPLAGGTIRYMHLGAVRPDLHVGSIVRAGDELGLLGGTGVQSAAPHVHIDVVDARGVPVDVAALIGLKPTAHCGPPALRAQLDQASFRFARAAGTTRDPLFWGGPLGVVMVHPHRAHSQTAHADANRWDPND